MKFSEWLAENPESVFNTVKARTGSAILDWEVVQHATIADNDAMAEAMLRYMVLEADLVRATKEGRDEDIWDQKLLCMTLKPDKSDFECILLAECAQYAEVEDEGDELQVTHLFSPTTKKVLN